MTKSTDPPDNVTPIRPARLKKDGMPAKPSGFAKGGSHYKGPALGAPASGEGIGGNLGWGSKGPGAGPEALIPGQSEAKRRLTENGRINKEAAAEYALGRLIDILDHPDTLPNTVVQAGNAVISHSIGSPVQRVVTTTLDDIQRMKDDEIAAELEAIRRKGASPSS